MIKKNIARIESVSVVVSESWPKSVEIRQKGKIVYRVFCNTLDELAKTQKDCIKKAYELWKDGYISIDI